MTPCLKRTVVSGVAVLVGLFCLTGHALAEDSTEERFRQLEERLKAQDDEIGRLREQLADQDERADSIESELDTYLGKMEEGSWMDDPSTLRAYYKNTLVFETADKSTRIRFGGRIMWDASYFVSSDSDYRDNFGKPMNLTENRRARLYTDGSIYENISYKAQYDFTGGDADFKDVWLALNDIGFLGAIKVGNFKVPFSLEEQTSSKYITFMERSLPNALSPGRQTGFGVGNSFAEGNAIWGFGIFNETDDYGNGSAVHNYAGRLVGTPVNSDDGLISIGGFFYYRNPDSGSADRIRSRPETHLGPRIVDSGTFDHNDSFRWGLEASATFGSFSAQAEYVRAGYSSDPNDNKSLGYDHRLSDPTASGYYVFLSYFLTGERRPWSKGSYGRVKPKSNFHDGSDGSGAVELALRYSFLDISDWYDDAGEGKLSDVTFGVNWHLNPNTRVMLNYIIANGRQLGDLDILSLRFQIDF